MNIPIVDQVGEMFVDAAEGPDRTAMVVFGGRLPGRVTLAEQYAKTLAEKHPEADIYRWSRDGLILLHAGKGAATMEPDARP